MRGRGFFMIGVVLLFLLVHPTSSQTVLAQSDNILLDPVRITAEMSSQGITIITFDGRMTNNGTSDISDFRLRIDSMEANVLSATVNGSSVGAYASLLERYTEIVLSFSAPLGIGESVWLRIRVRAFDLQSEEMLGVDGQSVVADFVFYIRPLNEYRNFTFIATLPEEALLSQESVVPIFPKNDSNFTDGRSISFVWFTPILQPGQERVYIIKYQLLCSQSSPFGGSLILLVIGIAIGIGIGLVIALFGPKILYRVRKIGRVRFVGVTAEEEEILDIIREKGGSCLQKDLYVDSEMSQAKVSLILSNLEERGLVRRFREGRENVVHIME